MLYLIRLRFSGYTHLGPKGKLSDAPSLMIVPNHHLIQGVLRLGPAANQRQNVTPEEHLNNADAAAVVVKLPPENLSEGVAVVDAETAVGAGSKAAGVLVEGEVEEGGGRGEGSGEVVVRVGVGGGGGSVGEEGDGGGVVRDDGWRLVRWLGVGVGEIGDGRVVGLGEIGEGRVGGGGGGMGVGHVGGD